VEAVHVSRRPRSPIQVVVDTTGVPVRLRRRGRWVEVRAVLARWVEAAPWWHALRATGSSPSPGPSRCEVWRVEVVERTGTSGVLDLVQVADRWRLRRVID
jgi:hypothetical protein